MKHRRTASGLSAASVVTLAALSASAGGAPPGSGVPANLISEVLPNGLRVTIVPEPANPVVATQLWYHVGSANESPDNRGFAHLNSALTFDL